MSTIQKRTLNFARRCLGIALAASILLSSFLVFLPETATAVIASDCAKLNGRSIDDVINDNTLRQLWTDCFRASLCDQDINQVIHCSESPVSDPDEYAKVTYASAVRKQAEVLCGGAGAPTSCTNNYVNKFMSCFDTYIKSSDYTGNYSYDLGELSECTDSANSSKFLTALTGVSSKVDAYTGGNSITTAATSGTATGNACGFERGVFNWVFCPVTSVLQKAARKSAELIEGYLYYPTDQIYKTGTPANVGLMNAWKIFRNIGVALIFIAGLVMIISQGFGLDLLDAYTVRKLMPRLAVSIIGIALSWSLSGFTIGLFNDIGSWSHELIITPFKGMPLADAGIGGVTTNYIIAPLLGTGLVAYLYVLGPLAALSLLGTIGLALFIGMVVLSIRWIVLTLCIILAPLAIAAYVLPGTQKLWGFWKNTFITTLVMFPLIMGFLAVGDVMGRVATAIDKANFFLILLLYFAPYFMLPFAFKMAGGLMSTIFSIANDKNRGLFDRMRGFRQSTAKRRWGKLAEGAIGAENGFAQRTVGTAARMTTLKDHSFLTKRGRDRFTQAGRKFQQDSAAKRAEEERGYAFGDTDEAQVAQHETSGDDFIQKLTSLKDDNGNQKYSRDHAEKALAKLEAGAGAAINTRAFKMAIAKGRMMDNAGFVKEVKDDEGNLLGYETDWEELTKTTDSLVASGAMDAAHAGAILGANQMRGSISSLSFGDRVKIAEMRQKNRDEFIASGGTSGTQDGSLTPAQIKTLNAKAHAASRASGAMFGNYREAGIAAIQTEERISAALSGTELLDDAGEDVFTETKMINGTKVSTPLQGAARDAKVTEEIGHEFATLSKLVDSQGGAADKSGKKIAAVLKKEVDLSQQSQHVQGLFRKLTHRVELQPDPIPGNSKNTKAVEVLNSMTVTNEQISEFIRSGEAPPELQSAYTVHRRELGLRQQQFSQAQAQMQAAQAGGNPVAPVTGGPGGYTFGSGP